MRKKGVALGVALATLALAALAVATTGSAAPSAKQAPIKAAWIYVGPHNDGGWSQAHDEGRLYVQKKMGANVITTYKENVPEGPQAAQVIDSLVRDGNKIIFATSFGFMDAMEAAAKKYPDVYFEHATGYKSGEELRELLRRRRGRDLPLGHGGRSRDEEGRRRLHRPLPDPRDHPAPERRSRSASRRRIQVRRSRSCGRSRGSIRPRRRRPPRASSPPGWT